MAAPQAAILVVGASGFFVVDVVVVIVIVIVFIVAFVVVRVMVVLVEVELHELDNTAGGCLGQRGMKGHEKLSRAAEPKCKLARMLASASQVLVM